MDALIEKLEAFPAYVFRLVLYPFDPDHRIFILYLATSAIIAYGIYRVSKPKATSASPSFLKFLFPKSVWSHPSAWLDLRYFFFHNLVGHFLMLGLGIWAMSVSFEWVSGGSAFHEAVRASNSATLLDLAITILYMLVYTLVVDFIGYGSHYLQHKLPILWHFHKVHHSAPVMHPLTNFREHPVDNLFYKLVIGFGGGLVAGLMINVTGYVPALPTLIGVPVLMFAFNVVGYNLRHSHIWLRWPGRWSMIFPSPAHHHIHHSCHPDHIDKNFAFVFPMWDVIFKTYHVPEDNRDVRFGVAEGEAEGLTSCLRLYAVPFRDAASCAWRAIVGWTAPRRASIRSDEAPSLAGALFDETPQSRLDR